ncbi:hypothetical protein ACQY0O_000723 [Thecaphora frezii]
MDAATIPKLAGSTAAASSTVLTDDEADATAPSSALLSVSTQPSHNDNDDDDGDGGDFNVDDQDDSDSRMDEGEVDPSLSASVTSSNIRSTQATTPSTLAEATVGAPPAAPARTASAPAPTPNDRSLTSNSEGLVLFDLTNKPGGTLLFSPHTVKTILDLKLLGVGYERQRLSFVQIRTQLAEKIADNVTVPALELADGSHIMESWAIAEYLERTHPNGHLIFGNSSTKRLAALLNDFGKTILAPHLGPLTMPGVHALLDAESAHYFANEKIGAARFHKLCSLSAAEKEAHVAALQTKLGVVETMLNAEGEVKTGYEGEGSEGKRSRWVAGGPEPSHADFVLFGWYVFSRAAGSAVVKDVWSAHPAIRQWVKAMLEWCGSDITNDLVPLS